MEESTLSMDSFVDIVANTVGMVIILTMLTVLRVDTQGIKVNPDLITLTGLTQDNIKLGESNEALAGSLREARRNRGLSEAEISAEMGLAALKKAESLFVMAKASRDQARASKSKLASELSSLKVERAGHLSAVEIAKQLEAKLEAEVQGFNLDRLAGSALLKMRKTVDDLKVRVAKLTEKKETGRAEYEKLEKESSGLDARVSGLKRKVENLRVQSEIVVKVKSPPKARDYTRLPLVVECYARPAEAGAAARQHVRFLDAYKEEGDRLTTPGEGEGAEDIAKGDSRFRGFLTDADDDFKKGHRLLFIVRPDAYAVFRQARVLAREAGWEVDWRPIEWGVAGAPLSEPRTPTVRP